MKLLTKENIHKIQAILDKEPVDIEIIYLRVPSLLKECIIEKVALLNSKLEDHISINQYCTQILLNSLGYSLEEKENDN